MSVIKDKDFDQGIKFVETCSKRLKNRSKTNVDKTFSNEEKNICILLLEISIAEALINTLCLFKITWGDAELLQEAHETETAIWKLSL